MTGLSVALIATLYVLIVAGFVAGFVLYRLDQREGTSRSAAPSLDGPDSATEETSWVRGLMMEVIIVHTDIGLSYEGLLVLESPKGLLLRNPKLLDDKRSPTTMAGELWIDRVKVHAVQTKPVELGQLPAAS